jgi:hypothetical protein
MIWYLILSIYLGDTVETKVEGTYETRAACMEALAAAPEQLYGDRDCVVVPMRRSLP